MEIIKRDRATHRPTQVKIARSHVMALRADESVWNTTSQGSFQNMFVHCNITEPTFVGSQMAKVIHVHAVDVTKPSNKAVEEVPIGHLMFFRLSQFHFGEIEIDIRDNQGRQILFKGGKTTAALSFRKRTLP